MAKQTTRRCAGSERFGIKPHDAPKSKFPKQPSQPDGLGRMCKPHWQAYVKGLRADAIARKEADAKPAATKKPAAKKADTLIDAAHKLPASRARRVTPAPVVDEKLVAAEALIAEVDKLAGPAHAARVGEKDTQDALEYYAAHAGPRAAEQTA